MGVMIALVCLFPIGVVLGMVATIFTPLRLTHFAYVDVAGSDLDTVINLFLYKSPPLKRFLGVEIRVIPGFDWTDKCGEIQHMPEFVRVSKMFFKPFWGNDTETNIDVNSRVPYNTLDHLKKIIVKENLKILTTGYY